MASSSHKPLIVVTGASAGIGMATARRFAKAGFRIVLTSRRIDRLRELQKEFGAETFAYQLDVRSAEEVHGVFQEIEKDHGSIDVLINNAGLAFGVEPAYEGNLDEWEQCLQTNIHGLLYCTHAVLPSMVKRDQGHIINIGSIAGTYPYPGGNIYGATKAFVHQLSLNLRADLLGTKVRVSCIEPGLVGDTEFSLVRYRGDAERASQVYEKTKALVPDDIAEVIFFCHALPSRININTVEIMPVMQAPGRLAIHQIS